MAALLDAAVPDDSVVVKREDLRWILNAIPNSLGLLPIGPGSRLGRLTAALKETP